MSPLDLVIGTAIAVVLTGYLVYALIRPEKF
jgi:K+-transporting ATPase KdpF subunit